MLSHLYRLLCRPTPPPSAAGSRAEAAPVQFCELSPGNAPWSSDRIEAAFLDQLLGPESSRGNPTAIIAQARLREVTRDGGFDVRRLPRMPAVLPALLQELRNDDAGLPEIAELVRRDAVLAGEVIRAGNSAYYSRGQRLSNVAQAVRLLGQEGLREVVPAVLMRPIHSTRPGSLAHSINETMWAHAQRCAAAGAMLARGRCNPFEAQLAGYVGAIGVNALVRLLVQEDLPVEVLSAPETRPHLLPIAWHVCWQACSHWDFPAPIQQAVMQQAQRNASSELARVLAAADRLAMLQLAQQSGHVQSDACCGSANAALPMQDTLQALHRMFAPESTIEVESE